MNKILHLILFVLILSSCNNSKVDELNKRVLELEKENSLMNDSINFFKEITKPSLIEKYETNLSKEDSAKIDIVYIDEDNSYFKTYDDSQYSSNEITYDILYIKPFEENKSSAYAYISKQTRQTLSCASCEGKNETIKVELSDFYEPNNIIFTTLKECNKIKLDYRIYKTFKYGCCLEENVIEYYDYYNNLIIRSNLDIISHHIPNSKIGFHVGYTVEGKKDDKNFYNGTLTIAYDSNERYIIKTFTTIEQYWYNTQLEVLSIDKSDNSIKETQLDSWSINGIKQKEELNNIKVVLKISDTTVLEVPIIKGKPYGKNNRLHKVELK